MNKQKTQLILVLVLLGVALAAFFGIRAWNEKEASPSAEDAVFLPDGKTEDINRIEVYEGGPEGTLRYALVRGEDGWMVEAEGTLSTAKADSVKQMLDMFENLSLTKPISGVTDYAQYGLNEPSVTVVLSDEKEAWRATLLIGDLSTGASMYYAKTAAGEEGDVYLITTLVKSLCDVSPATLSAQEEE